MVWFYIKRVILIIFVILNIVLILESKKESNIFYSQRPVVVESFEEAHSKVKINIVCAILIDKETGEKYRFQIDKSNINKPDLTVKLPNVGILTIFIFAYIFSTIGSIFLIIQVCSHNEEDSFYVNEIEQINKINKKIYKKLMLFFGYKPDILNKTFDFDNYIPNKILKRDQIELLYYSYYKKLYYKIKDAES